MIEQSKVHAVLGETYLRNGEVLVRWAITMEIAMPDGGSYLAHRSGEGHDGNEGATPWTVLGMLQSRVGLLEAQLLGMVEDVGGDDE